MVKSLGQILEEEGLQQKGGLVPQSVFDEIIEAAKGLDKTIWLDTLDMLQANLKDDDFATGPDRSFPIYDASHLKNAIACLQRIKNDPHFDGHLDEKKLRVAAYRIRKKAKKLGVDISGTWVETYGMPPPLWISKAEWAEKKLQHILSTFNKYQIGSYMRSIEIIHGLLPKIKDKYRRIAIEQTIILIEDKIGQIEG